MARKRKDIQTKTYATKETHKWMRRIHRFLREKATVKLAWMPDATGEYADDTQEIRVNPFFEFVSILIHEAIHGVAPHLTEREVLQKEAQLISELSDRQILYLIKQYMLMENGQEVSFMHTRFGHD